MLEAICLDYFSSFHNISQKEEKFPFTEYMQHARSFRGCPLNCASQQTRQAASVVSSRFADKDPEATAQTAPQGSGKDGAGCGLREVLPVRDATQVYLV